MGLLAGFQNRANKKKQAAQGEDRAAWLAKSSGEEGKVSCGAADASSAGLLAECPPDAGPGLHKSPIYIDDGLPVAVPLTVLVIRRTSTRRLSARPVAVLFDSTGLSLPRPIT